MQMRHHVGVSDTSVPSPRPGGDDDQGTQLPQQRALGTPRPGSPADDGPQVDADESAAEAPASEPSPVDDDPLTPAPVDDAASRPTPVIAEPRPAPDDEADPLTPRIADPRPAPDDAPAARASVERARETRSTARVYADGSALAQYVGDADCHDEWVAWAAGNESGLVTTPLGLTELRRFALPGGIEARGVAHEVEQRIEVVRFSDQTLRAATKVSGVLPPFIALHIGAALVHPGVIAVATYETQLARVAALHGLMVVSPGRAPFWWEHEG